MGVGGEGERGMVNGEFFGQIALSEGWLGLGPVFGPFFVQGA